VELAFHNIFDSVHFYRFFYPQNRKIESRLFQALGIALSIETDLWPDCHCDKENRNSLSALR
ncbi:hypothetical protein, partial [Klebsiella pneumoniae]|uniref:hypothetical protein n=1 Tax=Klebsiella pneumoniae TaxID=573 RepID=UPI0039C08728